MTDWIGASGFLELVEEVETRAPLVYSGEHGSHHWRLVAWTGAELLETMPRADPLVVLLFALFHDSQRENEYVDPGHGPRAADAVVQLVPNYLPGLEPARLDMLAEACRLHTEAGLTEHPTLGTCWDADRLNLWRVEIEPSPLYLSTDEAKRPERIEWALHLQDENFSWREIAARYRGAAAAG